MGASELGKVSRDKRRRATTSDGTIAADRDEHNRRRSQQEAPKPRMTNTSDATREAMATFRLDATGRPCRRTRQESCEGVVSITTNDETHRATTIIVTVASSPQLLCITTNRRPFLDKKTRADWANTWPWSPTTRASGSTKKKQKQAAKTSAASVTRGTCVTRATLAARTVQASWMAASGTPSPTKQSKHNGWQQQIPSWWIPHKKNECGLWCCLALALAQEQSHKTFGDKFGQWSWLGWCVQRCYLANFETASDADLKNGIQVEKTRAKYSSRKPRVGKYNSTDFKTHSTKNWEY